MLDFLLALASIRTPVLDAFFLAVTMLGQEVLYMAVALGIFWCGRKTEGYYLLCVGFAGTVLNQVLKLIFRIPRPFVREPALKPVEGALAQAGGYSFPSGHTQVATGLYGGVAVVTRRLALRVLCIAAVVLVAFSRMYLGVHTPADVLTSLALGTLLVLAAAPLFRRVEREPRLMEVIALAVCGIAFLNLLFVHLMKSPTGAEAVNFRDGVKNAWSLAGAALALPVIVRLDRRYIRFDGAARPVVQAAKIAVGIALLVGVKELLKLPLNAWLGAYGASNMIRYFLLVLIAGAGYPALFRYLPASWLRRNPDRECEKNR